MNFISELRWRGLLHEAMPGTEEHFLANRSAGYLGADPTGDSLHIGNLVSLMMLVHLQRAGHKPFALVGGATGMVGDPSGKDKERQLLSLEEIHHNSECIRLQMERFLDFSGSNAAEMVNNYDWLGQMGFLEFLRDVGKHITISYMMGKESVKKRLASESGISYTEFAYQLLQGYDYYWLYTHKGVRLQVGGSDQWGNITTGTELIRRKAGPEAEAFAAVCPLLTREDGSKFGKTAEGSSIWLDPKKTSPYSFFQYWRNASDTDAERFIKIFTLKGQEEIEALIATHRAQPHLYQLQKALAEDVTLRVHGESGLQSAVKLTDFLFGAQSGPETLSESDWQAAAQASDTLHFSRERISEGIGILDMLTELGITKSKGDARRAIEADKSVRINAVRVEVPDLQVNMSHAFFQTYLQLQKGKKEKYIVVLR
ncbi:MAG: tyrosine--tRNA ligase [Bacteroidetes bacterium]|nr:MAG: tyrosine--tRNA ligase [Bacteroidota bacterium]